MLSLRCYREGDINDIAALFYGTVHTVCINDYSADQLNAWADGRPDKAAWNASLLAHHSVVAESGGVTVGFGDIAGGYLDRLYVHKDHQGRGAATAILAELERHARESGETRIVTHASITARPFFEKRGYETVREQQMGRRGVMLTNYVMEKRLG